MRRRIREFPSYLPHANLYVDDLETIVDIFLEITCQDSGAPDGGDSSSKTEIQARIGRDVLDSVADLLEQGGSVADLEFEIRKARQMFRVSFRGASAPYTLSYGLSEGARWELYGKVKEVFERRHNFLKNTIDRIPSWVSISFWIVMAVVWVTGGVLRHVTPWSTLADVLTIVALTLFVALFATFAVDLGVRNHVYLVRSHERSKVSREARRKYGFAAFTFVLGAIVVELIHVVIARFLK